MYKLCSVRKKKERVVRLAAREAGGGAGDGHGGEGDGGAQQLGGD